MENSNIVPSLEGKEIRKVWHSEQWYFSIIDVIQFLTDSQNTRTHWVKLKGKGFEMPPFWEQLKMTAKDGKSRFTDCANTEGIMRITMSVPSPKLESLMRWFVQLCI